MASWAKNKLAKLTTYKSNNRLLLPPLDTSSVEEVGLAADLGCAMCQKRVADAISRIDDIESVVVHVAEKKVTLTRKSSAKGSSAAASAKASRVALFPFHT
ncbi:hypothetical protein GH714_018203 [Hevea brasiliensis]|uniref:HMA domain-containing protein n=1 Tax=Hevea brasiliensis TaxID=3981 RepID=A0A6A6NJ39_HEVBR|nr:uncharacterized protein LOC110635143 [Hevea brasiliensis]KAF2324862.1 hypothetical protein GH714_018174 [Hevea brasiliensis]KAF2324863.1 hypothetical protein GH714_018203 [Hevea brasiliensis]